MTLPQRALSTPNPRAASPNIGNWINHSAPDDGGRRAGARGCGTVWRERGHTGWRRSAMSSKFALCHFPVSPQLSPSLAEMALPSAWAPAAILHTDSIPPKSPVPAKWPGRVQRPVPEFPQTPVGTRGSHRANPGALP